MIQQLAQLAALAAVPQAELAPRHVALACETLCASLAADSVYVLQAGDPHFIRIGDPGDPTAYEIKQRGYGLVWRALAARPELAAGLFTVTDRLVDSPAPLGAGVPCTHVAMILPAHDSRSEMLVARGPWPDGLTQGAIDLLVAARPALATLVANVLDRDQQARQRDQLSAVGQVAEAISQSSDPATALQAICTSLASASGFDWVNLYVLDSECRTVTESAMNVARYSNTTTATLGARGAAGTDLDRRVASLARLLVKENRPDLLHDVLGTPPQNEFEERLQKYYERAHITSMASFPMVVHGNLRGMITYSSSTRRTFDPAEVELLSALVSQAANAVESVRLNRELRVTTQRLQGILANAPVLISVLDRDGVITLCEGTAFPDDDVTAAVGRSVYELVPAKAAEQLRRYIDEALNGGSATAVQRHRDRYYEIRYGALRDDQAQSDGVISVALDVTEQHRAQRALRRLNAELESARAAALELAEQAKLAETRFSVLFEQAPAMYVVTRADGRHQTIINCNELFLRTLGYSRAEVIGRSLSEFDTATSPVQGAPVTHAEDADERVLIARNGEFVAVLRSSTPDVDAAGDVVGSRVMYADIRDRRALQEQLAHQAFHDPLTDLPNRALFLDRLAHAVAKNAPRRVLTAVALLDLDDFKLVNDTLGHARGDELLINVTQRLRAYCMPGDTVARLGGDEFTVLIDEPGTEREALSRIHSLLQVFESPFMLGGRELFITASVGLVIEHNPDLSADDLVRRADLAMYEAKRLGKGAVQVFNDSLQNRVTNRFDAEADLRRGLENNEFVTYYQPIIDLNSHEVVGLEALARWNHPARGTLLPAEFIELAESSGMIAALGVQVLRMAVTDARDWLARWDLHDDFRVAVNLSVRQLERPNIVNEILQVLTDVGIEPHHLELEVTETSMMADGEAAVAKLHRLREAGVRIAIDDFGTGYSSLSYLKRLPVDTVKIDRSFVAGIATDASDAAIVQAVVAFAGCIGLTVIVEGVESVHQADQVRRMGCDRAQGYYFARPMTVGECARVPARRRRCRLTHHCAGDPRRARVPSTPAAITARRRV